MTHLRSLFVLFIMFPAVLLSCRATHDVTTPAQPLPPASTDHQQTVYHTDSVYIHDSIYVVEKQKGDTVFQIREVYRQEYKLVERHDTLCIVDSIPYPVPEPYPVEKVVTEYRTRGAVKILAWIGAAALAAGVLWLWHRGGMGGKVKPLLVRLLSWIRHIIRI